ncbi:MAG: hypothetical protein A2289_25700 [Deltaproteobacteria bacterium RIFOXYA12_FULL_58_15]|nr:MAG: hypothetical protein A2289_25700 [Deltaproteobacteria bacterium RIFOXYA12_FULL_58_15]
MRCYPDIVGRNWGTLVTQVRGNASETICGRHGHGQKADDRAIQEIFEFPEIGSVFRTATKPEEELSDDYRRQKDVLCPTHNVGHAPMTAPKLRIGIGVE